MMEYLLILVVVVAGAYYWSKMKAYQNHMMESLVRATFEDKLLRETLGYARDALVQGFGPEAGENVDNFYETTRKRLVQEMMTEDATDG